MKIVRFSWIAVALFLVAPSVLRAQEASFDTPNSTVGCPTVRNVPLQTPAGGARMIVRAWPNGLPKVKADVLLDPCDDGYLVVLKMMDEIDTAAVGVGYTCSATFGTCGGAVDGGTATEQHWRFTQPGGAGFSLTKFSGGTTMFHVAGVGGAVLKAINASTNAGNTVGLDLLPRYLVQVIPNGLNAVVTFRVFHLQGGQNPRSFTINTALFPDLTLLLNAIKAGFDGLGLGLHTTVSLSTEASFPEAFVPGLVVLISNAQQATRFEVVGAPGQSITSETSFPEGVIGLRDESPEDQARAATTRIHAAPNPFASRTGVEFALAKEENVEAGVFDVAGRQVRSLYSGRLSAGPHRLEWDGWDMTGCRCQSGIYFIRVERGGTKLGTKVFLLP